MPSWRGKLTEDQIWKLAAYVRSMSGLPSKDAVSSRAEEMSGPTPADADAASADATNSDAAAAMRLRGRSRQPCSAAARRLLATSITRAISATAAVENRQFLTLFSIFLVVCAIMYVLVIGFLVVGIARRRRPTDANVVETGRHHQSAPADAQRPDRLDGADRRSGLLGLAIASFFADRSMAKAAADEKLVDHHHRQPMVVGHRLQFGRRVEDAAHRQRAPPAGRRADANRLNSNDVIHSFWVPSLDRQAGPHPRPRQRHHDRPDQGRHLPRPVRRILRHAARAHGAGGRSSTAIRTSSNGGEHQLQPAPAPATPLSARRLSICDAADQCSACHNIAGTPAGGQVAPDLTHLASRRSLAAGTLPMSKGNLYGWVEDPQSIKPGNKMPTIGLEPDAAARRRRLSRDPQMTDAGQTFEHARRQRSDARMRTGASPRSARRSPATARSSRARSSTRGSTRRGGGRPGSSAGSRPSTTRRSAAATSSPR